MVFHQLNPTRQAAEKRYIGDLRQNRIGRTHRTHLKPAIIFSQPDFTVGSVISTDTPLAGLADFTAGRELHPALKIPYKYKKNYKKAIYSRFFLTPSRKIFILPLSFSFTISSSFESSLMIFSSCCGVLGLKRISVRR